MAFDIPTHVAKMLIEYRNRIAPKVIGHRPDRLFVNADGSAKTQWTVARAIRTFLRRAGIVLSPHQFRHVNAKLILEAYPGQFETVAQLLGNTEQAAVNAYAGIDSRRAGRHHQRLVEEVLAEAARKPVRLAANRASARKSRPALLRGGGKWDFISPMLTGRSPTALFGPLPLRRDRIRSMTVLPPIWRTGHGEHCNTPMRSSSFLSHPNIRTCSI